MAVNCLSRSEAHVRGLCYRPFSLYYSIRFRESVSTFSVELLLLSVSHILTIFSTRLKHVCGVLSLESPFEARPTAITDDSEEPLSQGSSRAAEKGVICTPPRRFYGAPDALLNRSRETLIEEIQQLGIELALPQVAG